MTADFKRLRKSLTMPLILVACFILPSGCNGKKAEKPEEIKKEGVKTKKKEVLEGPQKFLNSDLPVKALDKPFHYVPEPKNDKERKADGILNEAIKLDDLGKIDEALEKAKEATDLAPDYARGWNITGNIYYKNAKTKEAGLAYYKACKLNSNYASAWMNLGSVYLAFKRYNAAAYSFIHLSKLAPESSGVWTSLGGVYTELKQGDKAIACLEKAIKLDPKSPEAFYQMGFTYHCMRNYKKAEECYKKSLALNEQNRMGWMLLSQVEANLGKVKEARASMEKMQSISAFSNSFTGSIDGKKMSFDEQVAYFEKMMKGNPTNPLPYKNLAVLYIGKNQHFKAIPLLEKVVTFNPNDANTIEILASLRIKSGETRKAINELLSCLDKNSTNYGLNMMLSYAYYQEKEYDKAEIYARKACEITPDSQNSWAMVVDCLAPQEKHDELIEAAKRTLSLNPRISAGIWSLLATSLVLEKKYTEAEKALRKASYLFPNDYEIMKAFGICYGKQNKIDEAENYFSKAVQLNPEGAKCWMQLATIYKTRGNNKKYLDALVKVAVSKYDNKGIDFNFVARKGTEAKLAMKRASEYEGRSQEWLDLTHTPGQDRHFPAYMRGLD